MPFASEKLDNGDYEVIMQGGTLRGRVNYPKGADRRFALCTHQNDAQVIVDLLNWAETNGTL